MRESAQKRITIIGGCGHVGIPLGITLADAGHHVTLLDLNANAVATINAGKVPFSEVGAEEVLAKLVGKRLIATTAPACVKESNVVVFVTGTPVDEHHNPRVHDVERVIASYSQLIDKNALVVLRSTVFPGVIDIIDRQLTKALGAQVKLAFCPERIVQGQGIDEIRKLPQIVSGTTKAAEEEAAELFSSIAPKIVRLSPREAELAKLITNTWRYIEFAIANQFYMMLEGSNVDFYRVFDALKDDYPRAKHFARPGLAAGPCLFKDTMQLSAYHKNNFFLGQSAMLVNEGLPVFLAEQLEAKLGGLADKKVAILGMTFKADNDDTRESLSFKLRKVLQIKMADVIVSDPFVAGTTPLNDALAQADGIILGVPHSEYKSLKLTKPFVDCWGVWRRS